MKIYLEPTEAEGLFHTALCNGADYISGYGLSLDYEPEDYLKAKDSLKQKQGDSVVICREDVWLEILKIGGRLTLKDHEGGDDATITLAEVHARVQETDPDHLMDAINEQDDAVTADVILQTVFYGEVIFG